MSDKSKIEWTDTTWQTVTGCSRISPGCGDSRGGGCYAEKLAHKLGANPNTPQYQGVTEHTRQGVRWTGVVRPYEDDLLAPLHWRKPRRIFVNSMSDLFHKDVPDAHIDRVFATMLACEVLENRTKHTFQVLTKRAERMRDYFAASPAELLRRWAKAADGRIILDNADVWFSEAVEMYCANRWDDRGLGIAEHKRWGYPENLFPLKNVWIGVSVENQKYAEERLANLVHVPAAVRWVSAEPLLGPVDLRVDPDATTAPFGLLTCPHCGGFGAVRRSSSIDVDGNPDERTCRHCDGQGCAVDWIVAGAESGHRARPMDEAWVRGLRDQCEAAKVAFLYKQRLDEKRHKVSLPMLDGRQWAEYPEVSNG